MTAHQPIYVPAGQTLLVPSHVCTDGIEAKLIRYKGADWQAVHHGLDETIFLRNKGLAVDSPMQHGQFAFKARFKPFDHQRVTAGFLSVNRRAFCLLDLGLGKTASVLWACEYLRRVGAIQKALIICPLTTMRDTWQAEIFNAAPGASCAVVYGTREQRAKALASDADYYIINHDGIKTMQTQINARADIDTIVVDECTAFKVPNTDRTKVLFSIAKLHNRRFWALTGTPMPHLPTDIWTMAKIICPHLVPASVTLFRDRTCYQLGQYKWVPRKGASDQVLDLLEPAICYKKSEVLDMPPVITITRVVENTPEQIRMIAQLTTAFVTEAQGKKVLAVNAAAQISKILQVLQGVIITNSETGEGQIIGAPGRLATTFELIDASNSKTIVFAPYRLALRYLEGELNKRYRIGVIDGSVNEAKRAKILKDFAQDDSMRVLLAHPRTTSHGLNLTSASTIVWYGPVFSAETYKQAVNRIDRPGQTHNMTIAHLTGHVLEREIYKLTEQRLNVQDALLDLVAQL